MAKGKKVVPDVNAVIEIDPRQRLCEWDGTPITLREPPGVEQMRKWDQGGRQGSPPLGRELPEDQQPLIGTLLLNLLRFWEPSRPEEKHLAGSVGQKLAQAMKQRKHYRPGVIAQGILRQIVQDYRDRKLGLQPARAGEPLPSADILIYCQLAEAVGMDAAFQEGAAGEIVEPEEGG